MVFSVFWAISPQMRTEDVCLFHKFFVILLTYYHNTMFLCENECVLVFRAEALSRGEKLHVFFFAPLRLCARITFEYYTSATCTGKTFLTSEPPSGVMLTTKLQAISLCSDLKLCIASGGRQIVHASCRGL